MKQEVPRGHHLECQSPEIFYDFAKQTNIWDQALKLEA